MAKLSSKQRDNLPASAFVFPKDKRYPINDESHARNALARSSGKPEEDQVKAAVYRKYPDLKPDSTSKSERIDHLEKAAPLIADESQHIVYGVVLTPGVEDSQGDIIDASDIEKAAHKWLVEYRKHDVQHNEQPAAIEPVESFCAPVDFELGGQQVLKGSWVLGAHVNESEQWDRITKEDHPNRLTGFSIGGSGVRQAIADVTS